jgi:hypothetical protein
MTKNLTGLGVGKHDKHTPVRGQPFNAVNPPAVALKRPVNGKVMTRELRCDIAENNLKRCQLHRSVLRAAAKGSAAAPTTTLLGEDDARVTRRRRSARGISHGRKGQGCRQNGKKEGAHDAKHARIDRYRSLNLE